MITVSTPSKVESIGATTGSHMPEPTELFQVST
jgi:hypothetical protein